MSAVLPTPTFLKFVLEISLMNDMTQDANLIVPSGEFSDNERNEAKAYWNSIDINSYIPEQPWSRFIAEGVADYKPSRVFEFGCNAGKNLAAILKKAPAAKCFGIDINAAAIQHALANGLDVAVADEHVLKIMPDKAFDVCYTVSVLDHLPEPGPVLAELGRLSKSAVLLLEPWLGTEGKVVKNFNVQKKEVIDTTPYSYSWDYMKLGELFLPGWKLEIQPFPLNSNLGRYYHLYTFIPPALAF